MNRAEKHRQQKLAERASKSQKPGQFSIDHALQLAVQHHSAGRVNEAKAIYQEILEADPNQSDALHLLGVIGLQTGQYGIAIDLITKALAIAPNHAAAHSNLGSAFEKDGRLEEAVASFYKALAIKPDYVEAHYNLGVALQRQGKPADAVACYRKALAIKPDYVDAHNNLGNALRDLGQLDGAVDSYRQALIINSSYVDAHNNLGNALRDLGEWDEAVGCYQKALVITPNHIVAHYNLGNALKDLGRLEEAVASYHKALTLKPDHAEASNNLNFATRALQYSIVGGDRAKERSDDGLANAARATASYAVHQYYLAKFRPHETDASYENLVAALPPAAEQTIPISGLGNGDIRDSQPLNKMVALLHLGRSGTGLLHSLIDGHPEISTLPSIYFRGYFNEGVWDKISAGGWPELPERFAEEFAVLFDARSPKPIPSKLNEKSTFIGVDEGMTGVGENRDESLSLDRSVFCAEAMRLLKGLDAVDPMSFLLIVHAAYEVALQTATKKNLCFYHIHNPDDFGKANFLRYCNDARILMMVREPIQNCESTIASSVKANNYSMAVHYILHLLFDIDQIAFRMRESVGLCLEDLKTRPEATLQSLCAWLGVNDSPTLYEMTAQGKKWWGDPSSPDYAKDKAMSPFDGGAVKRPVGAILGEKDRFIFGTLLYPFSVRFGYREADPGQFKKDLVAIRPLLDDMLDFEKALAERLNIDHGNFKRNGSYQLLRAGFVDRWNVLDELGDYPNMLKPLSIG